MRAPKVKTGDGLRIRATWETGEYAGTVVGETSYTVGDRRAMEPMSAPE
ncbi:hypothetical protein LLH03_08885 [bacterium]|nr:hypothetical protein [bacterium]